MHTLCVADGTAPGTNRAFGLKYVVLQKLGYAILESQIRTGPFMTYRPTDRENKELTCPELVVIHAGKRLSFEFSILISYVRCLQYRGINGV